MLDLVKVQKDLEPEQKEQETALPWLRDTFQVTDDSSMTTAGEFVQAAKKRIKELEAHRVSLTKPLLDVKAGIDNLFKPLIGFYEEAERILKAKIGAFTTRREDERAQLMRMSAADHAAGGTPTAVIPEPATAKGVSVRLVWDFEVTEPAQVPREFCTVNASLIRARIPKEGDPPAIPGVRWFKRERVAVRVNT